MSKRRKGFPSETKVKRGIRIVHGHKELTEKEKATARRTGPSIEPMVRPPWVAGRA